MYCANPVLTWNEAISELIKYINDLKDDEVLKIFRRIISKDNSKTVSSLDMRSFEKKVLPYLNKDVTYYAVFTPRLILVSKNLELIKSYVNGKRNYKIYNKS